MAVDVDSYLDQALGLVLALLLPLPVGRGAQVTAHLQGDTGGRSLSGVGCRGSRIEGRGSRDEASAVVRVSVRVQCSTCSTEKYPASQSRQRKKLPCS